MRDTCAQSRAVECGLALMRNEVGWGGGCTPAADGKVGFGAAEGELSATTRDDRRSRAAQEGLQSKGQSMEHYRDVARYLSGGLYFTPLLAAL